ncbi:MAG TPA: universal stress protein [Dehalococcoidia bacterium]
MKAIVVPLDGSELAEQALPLVGAIATKRNAQVVLTTALTPGDRWVDDGFVRQWESEEQAAVESYQRSIIDGLQQQGVRARAHVDWGQPQAVIESAVEKEGAGLIVMSTHGRSGVSRWTLGSIADKVLRTTNTPLILIHATADAPVPETVEQIIVGLDGSDLAEESLPEAERFARALDASLLLVRAVVPPATLYGREFLPGGLPVLEQLEAEAGEYLERTAERLRESGLRVGVAVAVGHPVDVILTASRANGTGLIAITTHGRSGVSRWMFGSVADAVIRHGSVPVLVIRSRPGPSDEEIEAIPVAGDVVVPPPALTETEQPVAAPETHRGEARPHRPERSPGR